MAHDSAKMAMLLGPPPDGASEDGPSPDSDLHLAMTDLHRCMKSGDISGMVDAFKAGVATLEDQEPPEPAEPTTEEKSPETPPGQ